MTYTLGVSHAPRWMVCPAAPRLAAQAPRIDDQPDANRDAGLDGHYVAQKVLESVNETAKDANRTVADTSRVLSESAPRRS